MKLRGHLFPASIPEALEFLKAEKGMAMLINGGTDLTVSIREGKIDFDVLVDIGRISGLDQIEERDDGTLVIGSRVTMTQGERDPRIQQRATVLSEGCSWVGGPQIRNTATIAGNIVSAQPAADAAVPLFCLDARITVATPDGEITMGIEDAYKDSGGSLINPKNQIVTAVSFRMQGDNQASAYTRMMKRKALTLPILNCAVWLAVEGDVISDSRIAIGPVARTPLRMRKAEDILKGEKISAKVLEAAAGIVSDGSHPRSSPFRGGGEYRKKIVQVLVLDTLYKALKRLNWEVIV